MSVEVPACSLSRLSLFWEALQLSAFCPGYVNSHAGWDGVETDLNNITYSTFKRYLQEDIRTMQSHISPRIYGSSNSKWSFADSQSIAFFGAVSDHNHLLSSFCIPWISSNLYLLVQVNDQVQQNDSGAQNWNDSMEIYIDANNDKPTTYGGNDYQYRLNWTGSSLGLEEIKHGGTTGVTASSLVIAKGYIVEVKLPWGTRGPSSIAVAILARLDVRINFDVDNDNQGGKKAWFNTADTSGQNHRMFAAARPIGVQSNYKTAQTATALEGLPDRKLTNGKSSTAVYTRMCE